MHDYVADGGGVRASAAGGGGGGAGSVQGGARLGRVCSGGGRQRAAHALLSAGGMQHEREICCADAACRGSLSPSRVRGVCHVLRVQQPLPLALPQLAARTHALQAFCNAAPCTLAPL